VPSTCGNPLELDVVVPSAVQLKAKGVLKPEGTLQRFVGDDESGVILKIVRERQEKGK